MENYKNELSKAEQDVKDFRPGVGDEVLIEIVHGVKEILLLLINKAFDRAFPEKTNLSKVDEAKSVAK